MENLPVEIKDIVSCVLALDGGERMAKEWDYLSKAYLPNITRCSFDMGHRQDVSKLTGSFYGMSSLAFSGKLRVDTRTQMFVAQFYVRERSEADIGFLRRSSLLLSS